MFSSLVKLAVAAALGATIITVDAGIASAQEQRCHREAKRYADARMNRGEAALGSAIGGAAVGAIIGGVLGGGSGAGRGAIIGGSTGAVGGALGSGPEWQRAYDQAYDDCMDRYEPVRARAPEPVYRAGPIEPWTDEWFDYCSRKYRSFNPRTGTFTGYDGVKYFCQAN
jgi:uncharacterized protein YcfJ